MIQIRHDRERGCGTRKPGGLYLVSGPPNAACGKLPIPLPICPTCHHGIHPARGWTWVDGDVLTKEVSCKSAHRLIGCANCPISNERKVGRVGLLWCGERFYPTPEHWLAESFEQGVSRRIAALPRGFVLGKTMVFMAHRNAVLNPELTLDGKTHTPGIFHIFKPSAVEYVVKGDETDEEIAILEKRNITPVRIELDVEMR